MPLTRVIDHEDYMDYFSNRALPDTEYFTKRTSLESLYSASAVPGSEKVLTNYCTACDIPPELGELANRVKMVLVQPFMDAWNFDVRRVMKCCVGEITPDCKIIPFCAFNNLYRERRA